MNHALGHAASRSLAFVWSPWTAGFSAAVIAIALIYGVLAWRRSGRQPSMVVLEALRLFIVVVVALMLNQPEWVEEYRPREKPTIVVYHDASPSMDTRDVLVRGRPAASAATRREALAPLIDPASWAALRARRDVVVQPFAAPRNGNADADADADAEKGRAPASGDGGAPADGRGARPDGERSVSGTDLYAPLVGALERTPNLSAIVLASDGDWTTGPPPVNAAARLRMRGVPIFAVPVGSRERLPDVELLSFDLPTFGVAGKSIRVPFAIDSSMPRAFDTMVELKSSDGDRVVKDVRVAPMARTSDWIVWRPAKTGDFTLELTVPRHADERNVENNSMAAPIAIRDEKLHVLLVESYPRWEYRYLRNALSRDPGVELSCMLFHPGLSKPGGGNKDYIQRFPDGRDELSKYDVVFLGDVGAEEGQLTTEQCRLIKGLVEHQASGLVFMPGLQGREFSLMETELGDLCPVALDTSQPEGWGSREPSHFELTETGRRSLLTKLADTEDENARVWEALPGFHWYAPVLRARPGAEVLCVHRDAANDHGRLPLLATRTFGAGKVLFMGTDGAWRWRKGVEDTYHYRFWGQVVRWMAYQRNMARGETMRFYYAPDRPRLDQDLALHANVMDRAGEPLHHGEVSARVVAPSGRSELVQLTAGGEEWGEFHGRFHAAEPGSHRVTVFSRSTGATLEASFFVQGEAAERPGRPARPEVLEELARVTGGQVVKPGQLHQIVDSLAALPDPPPAVRRVPLWSSPALGAALIGLLGVFWIGRKIVGLV